jgi:hypothetical protein
MGFLVYPVTQKFSPTNPQTAKVMEKWNLDDRRELIQRERNKRIDVAR